MASKWKSWLGTLLTAALTASLLVATPGAAYADETPPEEPNFPTEVSLELVETTETTATLKATLDVPLEDSSSTLSLYRVGDPLTIDTAASGDEVEFTVTRPTSGYEQYYVTVASLTSNYTTVDDGGISITIGSSNNVTKFTINQQTPYLFANVTPSLPSGQSTYFVDLEDDSILTWSSYNYSSYTPNLGYQETRKEYMAVVADSTNTATHLDDLTNITTASSSIILQRTPWTISLETDKSIFTTDDPSPTLTVTTNQYGTGAYSYAVFVVDENDNIVRALYGSNSVSFSDRFYIEEHKTYTAYVAWWDPYNQTYETVDDLSDIKAVSNSVTIYRQPWTLEISIDQEEFSTDSPTPKVLWETNQSVNQQSQYTVFLTDFDTGEIIGRTYGYDNAFGTIDIQRFYTGGPRTYVAYIAKTPGYYEYVTNASELTEVQAISNTVSTERVSWEIVADIDKPIFTTDDDLPQIEWQTNQSLSGNAYGLFLVDTTEDRVVSYNTGSYYPASTGSMGISRFYNGGPHTYRIYVAKADYAWNATWPQTTAELEDIQAISNTVSATRAGWTLDISIDRSVFTTEDPTPIVTWTTNQSIKGSAYNYVVYLVDLNTEDIIASTHYWGGGDIYSTGTIPIQRFLKGAGHTYKAFVAKGDYPTYNDRPTKLDDIEDIQAESDTVSTERAAWSVSLGVDKTVFSVGEKPGFTWESNQALPNGTYIAYLVDANTGEIYGRSGWDYTSSQGYFEHSFLSGPPRQYRIVIAEYYGSYDPQPASADDFTDVQAVSNIVQTKRAPWNISLTVDNVQYEPYGNYTRYDLSWHTNQHARMGAYDIYVFNGTKPAGTNYSWNWDGYWGPMVYYQYQGEPTPNFIAYVADDVPNDAPPMTNGAADLTNIQARSTVVNPGELQETILAERYMGGGNPSEGNCNQQCYGDPVNSYNGEFFENYTDLSISSAIQFDFTRSYSSNANTTVGSFGHGWRSNYDMSLEEYLPAYSNADPEIKITQENGSVSRFVKTSSNGEERWVAPGYTQATLTYDENEEVYILTRKTNISYIFDESTGRLIEIRDLNGNTLSLSYSSSGKLIEVSNNAGKTLTITWTGDRISSVSDGTRTVNYSYNAAGNVNIVDLPEVEGHKQYVYDSSNRVTRVIHPNGGFYQNVYDAEGRVEEQVDPLQNSTFFEYTETPEGGKKTIITLADGSVKEEIYNLQGQLAETKMAVGTNDEVSYLYEYDYTGQVSRQVDPAGNQTVFVHDYSGNTISVTDARGYTTFFTYNEFNQLVETTNALGKKSVNTYDESGNLIATKSFGGAVTEYEVNANGTNAAIKAPREVANESPKKVLFEYDTNGHLRSTTQPEGGSVSIINDSLGNPLSMTNPLGHTVEYIYDSYHRLVETEAPTGATSEREYDMAGRTIKETDALDRETIITYDVMDRILSITSLYGTTTYDYDVLGRLIKEIYPDGTQAEYEYDTLGRLIKVVDPNGNESHTTYTVHSLVASVTDALGNTTEYQYDQNGNLLKTVDALDNESTAVYDPLNRLIQSVAANGYTETYTYDDDSNLIQVTKAAIETTRYEYDLNGNLVKTIYPDSSYEERMYDANSSLTSVKDRDGKTTFYAYNSGSQLIEVTRADLTKAEYRYTSTGLVSQVSYDGWATVDTAYTYDLLGRVTTEAKVGVETTYSYDAIGQMTRRGPPTGDGVEYGYDQYGKLTSLTYPSGIQLTYTYDDNGNLLTVGYDGDDLATYEYDANNNKINVTYANGVYEDFEYDELNRPVEITISNSTQELYKRELELNTVGFITNAVTSSETVVVDDKSYSYTPTQRLEDVVNNISSVTANYAYDSSSNLTASPWGTNTFSPAGQVLNSSTQNVSSEYTHDLRGNRTSTVHTLGTSTEIGEEVLYGWSVDNKLISYTSEKNYTLNSEPVTELTEIEYAYDSVGLLKNRTFSSEKTTPTNVYDSISTQSEYVWDTLTAIPTLVEDSEFIYLYGVGSAPFAQMEKDSNSNSILYLHSDERGSIVLGTLEDGEGSWIRSYDEYGSTITETPLTLSADKTTRFAYAGEYLDEVTGLYNLRARWYDPTTGGFLSYDPAVLLTGEGYSYASGNPLFFTDPMGLWSMGTVGTGIVGAVDGVLPIPALSGVLNAIAPGSIITCSPSYMAGNLVGNLASFAIPGYGQTKLITALGKLAYGVAKLASRAVSNVTGVIKNSVVTRVALDHKPFQLPGKTTITTSAKDVSAHTKSMPQFTGKVDDLPVFYVSKAEHTDVYEHHVKAFAEGYPQILQKGSSTASADSRRSAATKPLKTHRDNIKFDSTGMQADEYPYASTVQGGRGASVMYVSRESNNKHGMALKKFYDDNNIQVGMWFRVELVP